MNFKTILYNATEPYNPVKCYAVGILGVTEITESKKNDGYVYYVHFDNGDYKEITDPFYVSDTQLT